MFHAGFLLVDGCADASKITEIHPNKKRLAHDMPVRHEAPVTAVGAVVAIIAHCEIMPRWHGANKAAIIVIAIAALLERAHLLGPNRRIFRLDQDGVGMPAQLLA